MKNIFIIVFALLAGTLQSVAASMQQLQNLVCFVRFAGEDDAQFQRTPESYTTLFNGTGAEDNSVFRYFWLASYGQLMWTSEFCPAMDGGIKSYQTQMPRSYYQPYDVNTNPDGYQDATSAAAREQALVKEIAAWLGDNLPAGTNVDCNGDGIVDNLTIVFSGGSDLASKYMLWPHRSVLTLPVSIAGAKVTGYLLVFDSANGYSSLKGIALNTGVLCHEMSHSLGTYDLYHVNDKLNPVGVWDLMSDNQLVAQQMT
ncbi:MAG: immune inhibitor A, partial [Bacteroidales bacterium]|nr:immune inhibitor A [Bacteroidales bacterium]